MKINLKIGALVLGTSLILLSGCAGYYDGYDNNGCCPNRYTTGYYAPPSKVYNGSYYYARPVAHRDFYDNGCNTCNGGSYSF